MSWYPLQETFVWGEISPAFAAQADSEIYQGGVKTCQNMMPTHTGALTTRAGMQFIETILEGYDGDARVFPVDLGVENRVVLVLTDTTIHTYADGSFQRQGQLVENASFREGSAHWNRIGSTNTNLSYGEQSPVPAGDNYWVQMTANGGNNGYYTAGIKQTITVGPHDGPLTFSSLIYAPDAEDFPGYLTYERRLSLEIERTDTGAKVYNQTHVLGPEESLEISEVLAGLDTYEGNLKIRAEVTNSSYQKANVMDINHLSITYEEPPATSIDDFGTPYLSSELAAVQMVQNPYTNAVNFVHPNHPPQVYTLSELGVPSFGAVEFVEAGPGQAAQPHWVLSGDGGYPRAIGSGQGRVYYGGTEAEPQSVWTSKAGIWEDVAEPTEPDASTPVWYTMTALGYINWLQGGRRMLHGTSNGEHIVSAVSGIITESDIQVEEQSTNGSAHVQAVKVGYEAMYLSGDRRDIRSMSYDDSVDNYRTDNMTLTARHITRSGVRHMAYGRDPQKVVWCVLNDGQMAAMSYDPGSKLLGWHRHVTEGQILDVGEGRLGGVDEVYTVTRRIVDGVTNLQLESMRTYEGDKVIAMDNYSLVYISSPITQITGLERFGAADVYVQTASQLYGPLSVVAGVVTLPEAINNAYIVGIPFDQKIETMPARPIPAGNGSMGSKKDYSRISLRLYESSLPIVNGVRYKQKPGRGELKGWGEYASGTLDDYHQQHYGFDDLQPIVIEQDLPLKMTVTGIFGKLSEGEI